MFGMGWREISRDYLSFTKKEKIGIISLVVLIIIVWLLPHIISISTSPETMARDTGWIAEMIKLSRIDSLQEKRSYDFQEKTGYNRNKDDEYNDYTFQEPENSYFNKQKAELFYFDPNTLTQGDWERLGLRNKTIRTIRNFLSKGGRFYKPEDLQKIYGLARNEYARLAPYIRIVSKKIGNHNSFNANASTIPVRSSTKNSRYAIIDINEADTAAFISLPGIGNKLANRIVNFRNRLGGFYSVDQVKETYGLPDSTFQKIKQYLLLENTSLKKININTATKEELKMHPYIQWNIANLIVEYRNAHGNFSSIADLKKIVLITDDFLRKVSPYLII